MNMREAFEASVKECGDEEKFAKNMQLSLACYAYFIHGFQAALASQEQQPTEAKALTFDDALKIAKGCTDYGGGYRGDDELTEVYQHGIQTVINALSSAAKNGLNSFQVKTLHEIGNASLASQAQQESQCISVEERLPEDNSTVMAADQWGNIQITFYTENHDYFNHTYGYKLNRKDHGKYSKRFEWARKYPTRITHWMPLPPAPEED